LFIFSKKWQFYSVIIIDNIKTWTELTMRKSQSEWTEINGEVRSWCGQQPLDQGRAGIEQNSYNYVITQRLFNQLYQNQTIIS